MKRTLLILLALTVCLLAVCPCKAENADRYNISDYEWSVLYYTNVERLKAGLMPLTSFVPIQNAAHIRATELTRLFGHERPNNESCFSALDEQGIEYDRAGENIAAGNITPEGVVDLWMNSSGHRANILDKGFGHMGVGVRFEGDAYGVYWVQMFVSGNGYTDISIKQIAECELYAGAPLNDDQYLCFAVEATATQGGVAVMPLMPQFIKQLDISKAGTQTVQVSVFGLTAEFNIVLNAGDVNCDAKVNTADAVLVLRYCVDLSDLLGTAYSRADCNSDGSVDIGDAVSILKICAGF